MLGDKYTCFIGANNKKIGYAAGRWIVERLGGQGRVVELEGLMTSTPGQDRHSGFREAIATPLRILAGEGVPREITVGSRVFTQAAIESGGDPV